MAKTKQPPARKPIKARGALPSPRVAPQRDNTPWHGKIGPRIAMAVAALAVLAFIVNAIMDARDRAEARQADGRAVEQFERRVLDLNSKIGDVYEGLGQAPGALLAGVLPVEEYRTQADGWVTSFRELNQSIRNLEIPPDPEGLHEAKAHYVQGTVIYLDAAKVFLTAAAVEDPAERERIAVLGRNLFLHGAGVYSMGDRVITEMKNELELNDPPQPLPAPALPEEEVPLPAPPAAPPAPEEMVPDGTTGIAPGEPDPAVPGDPAPVEPAP
ncbi:MAG: hypothetical protein WD178_10075 [Actinomycetota bacterium]